MYIYVYIYFVYVCTYVFTSICIFLNLSQKHVFYVKLKFNLQLTRNTYMYCNNLFDVGNPTIGNIVQAAV